MKAVDQDGKAIERCQAKIKYLPGRWKEGEYVVDGKSVGHVSFDRQEDGGWRTDALLPDEEFTLTITAEGYEPKSETLTLPEGAVKVSEVRLAKKS